MDDIELLVDLHIGGDRQGPGGDGETRLAMSLAGLSGREGLKLADIGCGTGASTLTLATSLDAQIRAIDFLPAFLDELRARADKAGVGDGIETVTASMDDLPLAPASLDVLWSEGAIYNIGFENGIRSWRRLLKPGGVLAVSELTWLTAQRPAELTEHWGGEYPEVDLPSVKIAQLEANGYSLLGYFPLAPHCWLDNYYRPMQRRIDDFLAKHENSAAAQAIVAAEQAEIALYERHIDYVSYGFYVAQKRGD